MDFVSLLFVVVVSYWLTISIRHTLKSVCRATKYFIYIFLKKKTPQEPFRFKIPTCTVTRFNNKVTQLTGVSRMQRRSCRH